MGFVGGNFKMNGSLESLTELCTQFNQATLDSNVEIVVSPPAVYIIPLRDHLRPEIKVAAQNAYFEPKGAYTGEISITQVKDVGLEWVILGHSERRTIFNESDELIAKKTAEALKLGLKVILCIGENLEQRESGSTTKVVTHQVKAVADVISEKDWDNVVLAYETQKAIREYMAKEISAAVADKTRIIYGGSVAGKNSKELATQPDIDGFLVGGASP